MSKQNLAELDRDICQPLGRLLQEAFSNGLEGGGSIGVVTPEDREGVKLEWDFGVTPDISGDGKMVHGLDIKMVMDQDYSFTTKKYNATVRGARLQAYSQDNIGGRLMGAFIAAQAQGEGKTIEGYISGLTGPGMIAIEARTELATGATITTPAAVGILIYQHNKANAVLTGDYRALQIESPFVMAGGSISGVKTAIWMGEDWGGGTDFDYAFGFVVAGTSPISAGADAAADVEGSIKISVGGVAKYLQYWPNPTSG